MEDQSKSKHNKKTSPKMTKNKKVKTSKFFTNKIHNVSQSVRKLLGRDNKSALLKSFNKTINQYQKNGLFSAEEKKMVKNIVNIDDTKVGDVMTPRTDIIAVQCDANLGQIKDLIINSEHSRIPVFKNNLDNITGFIHSKDLAKFIGCEDQNKLDNFSIDNFTRKILYAPHSMRITDLLLKMRSSRVHIAIVLDEYGGTDGLVSIEDIVEEIVGEIEDEHDMPGDNLYLRIRKINENTIQVGGRVEIEKIADFLKGKISPDDMEEDFDTVGGLIFSLFKKVPENGEIYKHNSGLTFKILSADARSVKLVEIVSKENNDE